MSAPKTESVAAATDSAPTKDDGSLPVVAATDSAPTNDDGSLSVVAALQKKEVAAMTICNELTIQLNEYA